MSDNNQNGNSLIYLLAGFGLGVLVGAAAGLMYAPKEGKELRAEVGDKLKEVKGKTQEWVSEQKSKRNSLAAANVDVEEVGA
ncbi:MAG: YtxH domain-containing protein [Armatimonadetes bacterium]|nr:YtxH domain-containing protein [Armatimonadota bacterium]